MSQASVPLGYMLERCPVCQGSKIVAGDQDCAHCNAWGTRPYYDSGLTTLFQGSALDVLPYIPTASVDAIISDSPYPEISRAYGRLTEWEWAVLMLEVCRQARRILKPTGSAVFILQPNSRKVGSMRSWLWEFMAWVCREWNMVQDVWWWNMAVMPSGLTTIGYLTRPSIKACVWCGPSNCYRNQDAVLWTEAQSSTMRYASARASGEIDKGRMYHPSGHSQNWVGVADAANKRGGVTPFNLLPFGNTDSSNSSGAHGHGAGTPLPLADWWTRYIAPPKSVILDPFVGAGTMGVAALLHGHKFIGIDKEAAYLDISIERCQEIERQRQGEMHLRSRRAAEKPAPQGQVSMFQFLEEINRCE